MKENQYYKRYSSVLISKMYSRIIFNFIYGNSGISADGFEEEGNLLGSTLGSIVGFAVGSVEVFLNASFIYDKLGLLLGQDLVLLWVFDG